MRRVLSSSLLSLFSPTLARFGSLVVSRLLQKSHQSQVVREPYVSWAQGHVDRIKKVLSDARAEHTGAVKERIESMGQMKDVVSITEGLFALSKVYYPSTCSPPWYWLCYSQETAKLEAENFVQLQRITVASELKAVLDSWVRYEQQVKEREQADLTKTVIEKVLANLKDEKTQRDILVSAVAEVERELSTICCSLY